MDVGGGGWGILNPSLPFTKSTTASTKKVGDKPGKGLEDESMEVEATRSHSSS